MNRMLQKTEYEIKKLPFDFLVEEIADFKKTKEKDYLILKVKHINLGTDETRRILARAMHGSQNRVNYFGRKDKRGVIIQYFSVFEGDKELALDFKHKDIEILDCFYGDKLEIGGHKANRFEIIVRNLKKKDFEGIKKIDHVLNLFGEQRFGGHRNVTHLIGEAFVKRDFEKACMLILTKKNQYDDDDLRKAKAYLKRTGKFCEALRRAKWYGHEKALLQNLCDGNEFRESLRLMSKNLQILYVHAYQSYLWNRVAKEALKKNIDIEELEIVGTKTQFIDKRIEKIYQQILTKEKIRKHTFNLKKFNDMVFEGGSRKLFVDVLGLKIGRLTKDEIFSRRWKIKMKFELEKGAYATEVIRQIFGE